MNLTGKVININSELSTEEIDTLLRNWQVFPVESQDSSLAALGIIIVDRFDLSSAHLSKALKQKFKSFLKENYARKATLSLDYVFENEEFPREESLAQLFEYLKGNPTLILESEIEENSVSLRLAYWGANDDEYSYTQILDCYRSARLKNSDYLANFLLNYRCLIAGWMIDYHHLKDWEKSPLLPRLLPKIIKAIDWEERETIIENLVAGYDLIYQKLTEKHPQLIPQLYLELAKTAIELDKITLSKKLVKSSIKTWIRENKSEVLVREKMFDRLSISDEKYLQQLNQIYWLLNEPELAELTEKYLRQVKGSRQLAYLRKSMFQMPIFQGRIG